MRKVFDIRWSNYVKSVTSTVSAVLLVAAAVLLKLSLGYTPGASTGLVFVLFVMAVFASNAPLKIVLQNNILSIKRVCFTKNIPYNEIEYIARYNPQADMRLCASGGFFGYIGIFCNRQTGYYFAFMGVINEAVFIETTNGKRFVVSCEEPDLLVSEIRNRPVQE